jgi:hypothetical protein
MFGERDLLQVLQQVRLSCAKVAGDEQAACLRPLQRPFLCLLELCAKPLLNEWLLAPEGQDGVAVGHTGA